MNKRPSVADAISRKIRDTEPAEALAPVQADKPAPATIGEKPAARTRIGKKFITFPVSSQAKLQFDMLAVQTGTPREELMREALRVLFAKNGKIPVD